MYYMCMGATQRTPSAAVVFKLFQVLRRRHLLWQYINGAALFCCKCCLAYPRRTIQSTDVLPLYTLAPSCTYPYHSVIHALLCAGQSSGRSGRSVVGGGLCPVQ